MKARQNYSKIWGNKPRCNEIPAITNWFWRSQCTIYEYFVLSLAHYFPAAILVHIWCAPTWRFHTELCKFLRNISTNICGLGERTDLKLGEVSSLFIFNRTTISWLYPLNGFRFIFLLRDSENDLYIVNLLRPYMPRGTKRIRGGEGDIHVVSQRWPLAHGTY